MTPRRSSASASILALAANQGGIVAPAQAASIPGGRSALARLVAAGTLTRTDRVYSSTTMRPTEDRRLWMATLATGGVLSHRTAAAQAGASLQASPVEVTVDMSRRPTSAPGVTVHRARRLPATHVVTSASGLPTTTAPRTMVDLAAPSARLSDRQLLRCIDDLVVARALHLAWLQWFVTREAAGLTGRPRLESLLREAVELRADSAAEARMARLLKRAGLTNFLPQYQIRLADGTPIARVDFGDPLLRIALELDGYRFHSAPGVFEDDRSRGNAIHLAGWRLLRYTPRQLFYEPETVVDSISAASALAASDSSRVG